GGAGGAPRGGRAPRAAGRGGWGRGGGGPPAAGGGARGRPPGPPRLKETRGTFVLEGATDGDLARLAGEAVQRAGLGLLELRQEPLDLEEVFLHLIRGEERAS